MTLALLIIVAILGAVVAVRRYLAVTRFDRWLGDIERREWAQGVDLPCWKWPKEK